MAAMLHVYPDEAKETIEKAKTITLEDGEQVYLNRVYITKTKIPWKWWINSKGYFHCIVLLRMVVVDDREYVAIHYRLNDNNELIEVSRNYLLTDNLLEAIEQFIVS